MTALIILVALVAAAVFAFPRWKTARVLEERRRNPRKREVRKVYVATGVKTANAHAQTLWRKIAPSQVSMGKQGRRDGIKVGTNLVFYSTWTPSSKQAQLHTLLYTHEGEMEPLVDEFVQVHDPFTIGFPEVADGGDPLLEAHQRMNPPREAPEGAAAYLDRLVCAPSPKAAKLIDLSAPANSGPATAGA